MEVHIHWDQFHTLGPLLGPIMMQLVLLSSGREDERFTVEFEDKHVISSGLSTTVVWFSSKKSCR